MIKIPDSPQSFFKIIPTDVKKNIQFRIELNKMLAVDKTFQTIFLAMCREYYPIFFNTVAWTLNPQKPPAERNQPFILRPAQIPAVLTLNKCIDEGRDAGLNKSRKEGASEICCKLFAAKALLEERSNFILGSRKKELVDCFGDQYTLFAKIDHVLDHLPSWWLKLCGYDPSINRKDMLLTIPFTQSGIVGETTNESFSAGSRGTAILLDEFGRVEKAVADAIEGSIHDVANCVIYSSTHWLGINHTFNVCLEKPTTEKITLIWSDNPEENYGLYRTPEPGKIQIVDIDYYRSKSPSVFSRISSEEIIDYDQIKSELPEDISFVADGLKGIPSEFRSPWFDNEWQKRKGNKRDFICNICATPLGASDAPFDAEMLKAIRETEVQEPDFQGNINFETTMEGIVDPESPTFFHRGSGMLKWWGGLPFGRPDQSHNYVIAVDPSYGLGSANSAAFIEDVNLREQVGSMVDANTKPEDFADLVVALAYWIGGVSPAYIIWESNAGCGQTFGNRVIYNQYYNVYTQRVEDAKTRKKTKKWGWHSSPKTKELLLGELGVALSGGLEKDQMDDFSLVIRENELVDELTDCVFKEKGVGIISASKADLSTGALERHGDRVIGAGLAVLGTKEQGVGKIHEVMNPKFGSFRYWELEAEKKIQKNKRYKRRFLF
jgi:hypothetical protein